MVVPDRVPEDRPDLGTKADRQTATGTAPVAEDRLPATRPAARCSQRSMQAAPV